MQIFRSSAMLQYNLDGTSHEIFYLDQLNGEKPNYCAGNRTTRGPLENHLIARGRVNWQENAIRQNLKFSRNLFSQLYKSNA